LDSGSSIRKTAGRAQPIARPTRDALAACPPGKLAGFAGKQMANCQSTSPRAMTSRSILLNGHGAFPGNKPADERKARCHEFEAPHTQRQSAKRFCANRHVRIKRIGLEHHRDRIPLLRGATRPTDRPPIARSIPASLHLQPGDYSEQWWTFRSRTVPSSVRKLALSAMSSEDKSRSTFHRAQKFFANCHRC